MTSNATSSLPTYNWQSEPDFRGTFGIVSACLSTLAICVWNALHLDIPFQEKYSPFLIKLIWAFYGVFCPELVALLAYVQRATATSLVQKANEHLGKRQERRSTKRPIFINIWYRFLRLFMILEDPKRSSGESTPMATLPSRRHAWTIHHGFYATMGGFVLDTTDPDNQDHEPFLFLYGRYCTKVVLTGPGVAWILEHDPDLLPDLSEETILDRSKADGFAKFLLVVQVSWFCCNCIGRLAQHLPLTLLETLTLAHAGCSLVSYLLWWNKPLDVKEPSLIQGPHAREICALLGMATPPLRPRDIRRFGKPCPAEAKYVVDFSSPLRHDYRVRSRDSPVTPQDAPFSPSGFQILDSFESSNIKFILGRDSEVPWWFITESQGHMAVLEHRDIVRWRLAHDAIKRLHLSAFPEEPGSIGYIVVPRGLSLGNTVSLAGGLLPALFLSTLYSFIYFLGWGAQFPTLYEWLLWQGATFVGFGAGVVFTSLQLANVFMTPQVRRRWGGVIGQTIFICIIAYWVSEVYLVVESIRQLFYLPPGAYELPSWSNYFPHFS